MSSLTRESVLAALAHVEDPDLKKDLVTLGMIEKLEISENEVAFDLVLTTPACPMKDMLVQACKNAIRVMVDPNIPVRIHATSRVQQQKGNDGILKGVKHVVAVGSGKGGVGKSTVSASLALSLAQMGAKVGLLDADIYGPSIPTLFGVHEAPEMREVNGKNLMVPIQRQGISLLSIGFMTAPGQAVVWRGPMVASALKQFIQDVDWGELDYLIVDLPPGTGDVQLSLAQTAPLSGVVIVTTPQEMALADARRAIDMFRLPALEKPILGVIENMSYFTPDEAPDKRYCIFGQGGGQKLAQEYGLPLLSEIPMDPMVMQQADEGALLLNSATSEAYQKAAQELARQLSIRQFAAQGN
ncbi:MAG: Mrp/NBP35 family ATP-binding protein [Bacteroidia bacterium]